MSAPDFEWDPNKAAQNAASHGVSFDEAKRVFRDPNALDYADDREDYGEDRSVCIGNIDGELFYVAYTERGTNIRIISARRAGKQECDEYYRQNSA